jgi:ATP-grasp domain-containing protein
MKVNWLLEKDTFEDNVEPIEQSIKELGLNYKLVDVFDEDDEFLGAYPMRECVIFYGSLGTAQRVVRSSKWAPGAWCDVNRLECTFYYPRLGAYLLNDRYTMLPYGDLLRQQRFLFEVIGQAGKLFIRPNSAVKRFAGTVVSEERFEKDVDFLGFYDVEPHGIVVVASPKDLQEEWRLVVVRDQVVASCLYKVAGESNLAEGSPRYVRELAQQIVQTWCRSQPG